ncbi:MAG: hypothetical protein AB7S26_38345 [Sandaracinaceae bacterium]
MSDPIKPPGGPRPPHTTQGADDVAGRAPDGAEKVGGPEAGRGEFRAEVDAAASSEAASAPAAAPLDAAMERAIERAMASAKGLSPEQRDALEAQLRDALAEDPTLLALQRDVRRAGGG